MYESFKSLPEDKSPLIKLLAFIIVELLLLGALLIIQVIGIVLIMVSQKSKAFLTEHTITLGESFFTAETRFSHTEAKWFAVEKLARTRNHFFIYVSKTSAHVIPRRAFHDITQWDAFYDFCKRKTGVLPRE